MKTMRPNLTIQLNRSRKNSSLDINNNNNTGGLSGFMTPIDQTISTPAHPPPNPQYFPYQPPGHNNSHTHNPNHTQQQQQYEQSDVITPVVSRNESSFSLYSDDEQMTDAPPPPQHHQQQQPPNLTRTSSIASSIAGDNFVSNNINFTKKFDALILNTYQSYVNRPDITPFDPKHPPSGIASRVSRDVLNASINERIPIDYNLKKSDELWMNINLSYTLTVIRKRLFELCEPHRTTYSVGSVDETPIEMPPFLTRQSSFVAQHQLQRQNSVSSQTFPPINSGIGLQQQQPQQQQQQQQLSSQHKPSWLHLNSSFMTHRLSSTDSLVENVNLSQQQQSQPNSRSNSIHQFNGKLLNTPPTLSGLSRWTSNETDFEMKKVDYPNQNIFQPPHFPGSNSNNLTPPQQHHLNHQQNHHHHHQQQQQQQQLEESAANHLESPFHPSFNLINATNNNGSSPLSGLQSPFEETFITRTKTTTEIEVVDPLYNATHNRKRESLIKKRSGK